MRYWTGFVLVAIGVAGCGSGQIDPCADVECPSGDPCIEDGVCDSGECVSGGNAPEGARCNLVETNDGYCDGMGVCVQCTVDSQCADGNECTADLCDPDTHSCHNPDIAVETECNAGLCVLGFCVVFSCEGIEDGTFCAPEVVCLPPSAIFGACVGGTCQCVSGTFEVQP